MITPVCPIEEWPDLLEKKVRTYRMSLIYRDAVLFFKRQRRGMSIAQGMSPGMLASKEANPLSLWERGRVREALKGRNK
ncbi:MAG: hypothetical protein ACE15F_20935 [bacterium]